MLRSLDIMCVWKDCMEAFATRTYTPNIDIYNVSCVCLRRLEPFNATQNYFLLCVRRKAGQTFYAAQIISLECVWEDRDPTVTGQVFHATHK